MKNREDLDQNLPSISFTPDWSADMTAGQAEKELNNFEWKGCGWYFTEKDSMLVTPLDNQPRGDDRKFMFHVWNNSNPHRVFHWIATAPVR